MLGALRAVLSLCKVLAMVSSTPTYRFYRNVKIHHTPKINANFNSLDADVMSNTTLCMIAEHYLVYKQAVGSNRFWSVYRTWSVGMIVLNGLKIRLSHDSPRISSSLKIG